MERENVIVNSEVRYCAVPHHLPTKQSHTSPSKNVYFSSRWESTHSLREIQNAAVSLEMLKKMYNRSTDILPHT